MFVKDIETGVVYNDSEAELRAFMSLRERAKREKQLCREIDDLKRELCDIRNMFQTIMNREGAAA